MAHDITWLGNQYSGVPFLELPATGGGTARFDDCSVVTATASDVASGKVFVASDGTITTGTGSGGGGSVTQDQDGYIVLPSTGGGGGGGGQYAWLGDGAEKVGRVVTKTINLHDDAGYDNWTPTTTATDLIAAEATASYTYTADIATYDYCFVIKGFIEPVYAAGTPMTYTTKRVTQYYLKYYYGYPSQSSISNIQTDTAGSVSSCDTIQYLYHQTFYNNVGALTAVSATQCGPLYMNASPSIAYSSFSNGTVQLSIKFPAFRAKCDTARFTTERAGQVDSANTNYTITVDLYRVPHGKGLVSHLVSELCADQNA